MDDMFNRRRAPISGQSLKLQPKTPTTPNNGQPLQAQAELRQPTQAVVNNGYSSVPAQDLDTQTVSAAPVYETPKTGKAKKVFTTILFILLLAGAGFLGYTYKITNDKLRTQSQRLSSAYKTIETFQAIIDQNQTEKDFVAKYNTPALSVSQCSAKPMSMFDVHATSSYVVYRFLCANSSNPIRIGAFQKQTDGSYKFAYGASTLKPNDLPGFIYDTDAAFFHLTYGSNRI